MREIVEAFGVKLHFEPKSVPKNIVCVLHIYFCYIFIYFYFNFNFQFFFISFHFISFNIWIHSQEITTMTQYNAEFSFPQLFPPQSLENVLSFWLSKKGLIQYHVAETEKYAHVTFFFNGGQETCAEGEERKMVPSPKVATYDLQPEMNAAGVADEVVAAIETEKYPFVLCNFAPPDMVGHTGKYDKAILGVEATGKWKKNGRVYIRMLCKLFFFFF